VYLQLILATLSLIEHGAELIPKLRAAAKQSGELTPEQEAELDDRMAAAFASDRWKTDDQLAADRMAGEGGAGA
jgi:hypothetical protein